VGFAVLLAAVLVGGALVFVRLPRAPANPEETVRRLWKARGVEKPNLVLITLDTTRADRLGCYGYASAKTPHIDALAKEGVLFEQAASPVPLTQPAHSSLMTGTYPTYHGVRINGSAALSQAQTTLAEILGANGYQTGAFIGAFVLDKRWGLNQGFQVYDDQFDLKKFKRLDLAGVQRPADQVTDSALAWLEREKQNPFFAWIHFYDPHTPYEPPEPYAAEYGGRGPAGLYEGEIAFVDSQVGRLVSFLETNGIDHRTVLVLVGDHGESLGSHGEGTHGYFVYDYALHVPLVVAAPFEELRAVRVESQVSMVDVFPTVLSLLGIESDAPVQGRSLVPAMFQSGEAQESYAYAESMTPSLQFGWSPLHSLRSSRYKWIEAPKPELYDLLADPEERTNVYERNPGVAREMKTELDRLMRETAQNAPEPEAADFDKETIESLAALGYIGGPAPRPLDPSKPLADPKDKLRIFSAVQQAGEWMVKDEYPEAVELLESALQEEPGMSQAHLMLGTSYAELGKKPEAKVHFDLVLKDDPRSVQALIGMANILIDEGRSQDVIALCKRTLSLDERNPQAYTLLGEVHVNLGKPDQAVPYFEKALEVQPKLTQNRLNLAGSLIEVQQYDRAERLLNEILRDYPRFPLAQFNLGLLHEEQGQREQARSAYAAEVEAYPQDFRARFNLGKLLFQLGDRSGSLEQMREVIRIAPEQPEGYLFLARGLLRESSTRAEGEPEASPGARAAGAGPHGTNRKPAALDEIQALVEKGLSLAKTPDTRALGYFVLADVYHRLNRPDKASEALRQAEAYAAEIRSRSRETKNP
jgi:arylsulfatase A-like enzyme/tetratricopeptide (TPR) repeat protein